jgi:hypothetical protein
MRRAQKKDAVIGTAAAVSQNSCGGPHNASISAVSSHIDALLFLTHSLYSSMEYEELASALQYLLCIPDQFTPSFIVAKPITQT